MTTDLRVSPGYNGLTPVELIKHAKKIIEGVTKNLSSLPNCTNFLAILTAYNNDLSLALDNQKPGEVATTSAVRAAVKKVKKVLRVLAANVEFDCNDDITLVLSTGFSIKNSPSGATAQSFKAKAGKQSGTIETVVPAYQRAAYNWYIANDPLDSWSLSSTTTNSKFTYKGLTPLKKYWVRVAITQGEEVVYETEPYLVLVL